MKKQKLITLLGSTGSIGTQALDVVRQHPDRFGVYALVANNSVERLAEQVREFRPQVAVIANEAKREALSELVGDVPAEICAGTEAICQVAASTEADIVLAAMVGFAGLRPTIKAIEAGRTIALANKETLVVAGELITRLSTEKGAPLLPVDSEHSAIFQCLAGERGNRIEKILLTASGGPFRTASADELRRVTPQQALRHPQWAMGAKITIDSATMMNKGFEVIEARWLFDVAPERIEVLVHPESIMHSAVQFADGAVKAQLGVPDMRLPIQYAFTYPERPMLRSDRLDLLKVGTLHFEAADTERFPCLAIAYDALRAGGNMPCIVNAANEVLNEAFRAGRITFLQIGDTLRRMMVLAPFEAHPTLETYIETDKAVRQLTEELI